MAKSKPFARLDWEGRSEVSPPPAHLSHLASVIPHEPRGTRQPNTLIHGDNLAVMHSLLPEYRGGIDLIYADPPFHSGKAYTARIGRYEDSRRPDQWRQINGFHDKWEDGSAYLQMLYPRLRIMHELLSKRGTLYLHLDWHAAAYARIILDEIFGPARLLNEIIWTYHGPSPIRSAFKRKHDTILIYTKSDRYTFNADDVRIPYNRSTHKTFASSKKAGFGKTPDLEQGKVPEDWWYFPVVARLHNERTGYPTQKPAALLERIILASSNPSDLVADFFCGSGTTLSVAQRLGRRWVGCDTARLAIQTTQRRLLLQPDPQEFKIFEQKGLATTEDLDIDVEIQRDGFDVTLQLTGIRGPKREVVPLTDLVMWQVDWEHSNLPYRYTSFACLPWREGTIPTRLSHRYSERGGRTLSLHAVLASGRSGGWTRSVQV